jgi:two-component system copper resistance phosphate regulon response regulator CusR
MAKILLVEDSLPVVESVRDWMEVQNHNLDVAMDGAHALEMLGAFGYELVILDWDLPRVVGIDVLKQLRARKDTTPVLMLTGKDTVDEKEQALDAGADDYLTKPFNPRELAARIRALLRRPQQMVATVMEARGISIDPVARKVLKGGKEVSLQPLELTLLEFFMRHPNELFSTDQLLSRVWDSDADVSLDALYACITRLRRKIDEAGQPSLIRTVHGSGYRFEP